MSDEKKFLATDPMGNKVFMGETEEVAKQSANIDKLLWMVAPFMGWPDLDDVFVSDGSSLSDFGLDDEELQQIQTKLGFPIKADEYLHEIAARMEKND